MAANEKDGKKMSARQMQARKKRKLIIFGAELVIIVIMVGVLWWVMDFTGEAPHVTEQFSYSDVYVDQKVQDQIEEGGAMKGYMNIALFGVDAKSEKELFKSSRSDTIMVASINLDSGDIKLVSILRDTYLNQGNDTYKKCNAAYAKGGAQQAVGMLNMNLDMDITNFVTVGYAGLAEVIDGLGGIYIDVDEDEMQHINNYQYSIIGKYAKKYLGSVPSELNFTPDDYFQDYEVVVVNTPGYQLLNGLQAAAYCRIRYVGNDFQRTARQREVIKAIEARAKQADLATLTKVFESAIDDVYTNLDVATILTDLLPNIAHYKIVDEGLFPEMNKQINVSMGANGSCQIPVDLSASVSWLHGFLFGDINYETSDTVKEISRKITADASKYRGND